jgi:polyhydroxyalkanoate synthase subunit PhaC
VSWTAFEPIDVYRRSMGTMMDALGWGPVETPSRVVLTRPGVTLKTYADGIDDGTVALIVPAPIKRAYIWDLVPEASVVQQCMRGGVRVYLIQWEQPGLDEQGFGLAEYADRLILACLDAIANESGQRSVHLLGHSLGGTFAAIFSALYPERVRGLTLLGAPLQFGSNAGAFAPLVAASPNAQLLTAMLGNVPGSLLSAVSLVASPTAYGWSRWFDWLSSLPDTRALETHLRVERWMLDEMPLAAQLFAEVVELLYREDRFMRGSLTVRGRRAAPVQVRAPILSIIDPRSCVVPPESMLPFHAAVRSAGSRVLWYEGDTGVAVQHVGMLVGESAHRRLWPEIVRWLQHDATGGH